MYYLKGLGRVLCFPENIHMKNVCVSFTVSVEKSIQFTLVWKF